MVAVYLSYLCQSEEESKAEDAQRNKELAHQAAENGGGAELKEHLRNTAGVNCSDEQYGMKRLPARRPVPEEAAATAANLAVEAERVSARSARTLLRCAAAADACVTAAKCGGGEELEDGRNEGEEPWGIGAWSMKVSCGDLGVSGRRWRKEELCSLTVSLGDACLLGGTSISVRCNNFFCTLFCCSAWRDGA